ncbi:hypothetical protein [Raineya orbicola]|jgi:hypothetical protein|uniref:Uncharacterized protein n=1 Tax=Raineya orbicola TaxID=2016530 RepID=A0A2N3IF82_9BACT|nr:hypothetical protein [Raineya orbicola]PKQ68883.1 hypothetical protein Rain11_1538 [Raineya orbicola]
MSELDELKTLWEEYNFNRLEPIDFDTFQELVWFYPILAVLSADNNIDGAERNFYLEQLEKKAHQEEHLQISVLKREAKYIAENIRLLENLFISALKILVKSKGWQNALMDNMLNAAKVSYEPWQTKTLYGNSENHLKFSKKVLDLVLEDVLDKKERVSEEELAVIVNILQKTEALNERNQMILEVFENSP